MAEKVHLRILCGSVGTSLDFGDFRKLYEAWANETGAKETYAEAERLVLSGHRLVVLALHEHGTRTGFSIADLKAGGIGWMYVAPEFRGVEVYSVASMGDPERILEEKPGLKLWQLLNKKAWTMVKMNGAADVASIIHKEAGGKIAAWRREHEKGWPVPQQKLDEFLSGLEKWQEKIESQKKPQKSPVR